MMVISHTCQIGNDSNKQKTKEEEHWRDEGKIWTSPKQCSRVWLLRTRQQAYTEL